MAGSALVWWDGNETNLRIFWGFLMVSPMRGQLRLREDILYTGIFRCPTDLGEKEKNLERLREARQSWIPIGDKQPLKDGCSQKIGIVQKFNPMFSGLGLNEAYKQQRMLLGRLLQKSAKLPG